MFFEDNSTPSNILRVRMRKIPPYRYNNAIMMIRFFTFSDIGKYHLPLSAFLPALFARSALTPFISMKKMKAPSDSAKR